MSTTQMLSTDRDPIVTVKKSLYFNFYLSVMSDSLSYPHHFLLRLRHLTFIHCHGE